MFDNQGEILIDEMNQLIDELENENFDESYEESENQMS